MFCGKRSRCDSGKNENYSKGNKTANSEYDSGRIDSECDLFANYI